MNDGMSPIASDDLFLLTQACALWNSGDRDRLALTESLTDVSNEYCLWARPANSADSWASEFLGLVQKDAQGLLTPLDEQTSFATTTTLQH